MVSSISGMRLTAQFCRRQTIGLSLSLAFVVLAISLLFYSPCHQHARNSTQPCTFSQFEHGGFSEPPATAVVPPTLLAAWNTAGEESAKALCLSFVGRCAGRAPPADRA